MEDIQLFVEFVPGANDWEIEDDLRAADGFVFGLEGIESWPQAVTDHKQILRGKKPPDDPHWQPLEHACWVVEQDLEDAVNCREQWPQLQWVPRITIYRQETQYGFKPESLGDGFRFFSPDPATINSFLTVSYDQPLLATMRQAQSLGFATVWLHSQGAEQEGKGLELDVIAHVSSVYRGQLWLSGGAGSLRHLRSLQQTGGVAAVVIPYPMAKDCGCQPLQAALHNEGLTSAAVRVELGAS